jgi:DNA-binding CsgD family transcriptional regulator
LTQILSNSYQFLILLYETPKAIACIAEKFITQELSSTVDGFIPSALLDEDLLYLDCSSRFCELTGLTKKSIVGCDMMMLAKKMHDAHPEWHGWVNPALAREGGKGILAQFPRQTLQNIADSAKEHGRAVEYIWVVDPANGSLMRCMISLRALPTGNYGFFIMAAEGPGRRSMVSMVDGVFTSQAGMKLGSQELDIVEYWLAGLPNARIGKLLGIKPYQVRSILERLARQIGVPTVPMMKEAMWSKYRQDIIPTHEHIVAGNAGVFDPRYD